MENNQFPQREYPLPEETADISAPESSPEELPQIEELTFEAVSAAVEEPAQSPSVDADTESAPEETSPAEEIPMPLPEPEDFPMEEIPAAPEVPAEEIVSGEEAASEEVPITEELAPEPKPDFMDRIPDVDEDYPPEPEAPEAPKADTVDLLEIINDPEFAASQPAEQPAAEVNDQEYRDVTAEKEAAPSQQWVTRKGRPKRKKGEGLLGIPNILVTAVWLALIVMIGVTLGRMLWICAADVLAFGREDRAVTITIYEADTMEDIVDKLHANGLIRYKSLFNLYASISDAEEEIKPGIYDLNTRYDYHALVNFMSPSSTRSVVELTIPEGYTCRQIFSLLEENRVCTAVDIAAYAADGTLSDYWFLEGVDRGSEYCLEGYLFPDTYQFYKNSTPREALEKMLDNFNNRFTEEMRVQIETLNANVTGGGFTMEDVVTVASLIEKESAHASESAKIAGVIYNRLYNWEYPAFLNIDAAIVYAQDGDADVIDTNLDSPYNTYRYTGLTPTPISNPGLSSLEAALSPESHNHYYYVLNPATGRHQFSTTQDEHNAWISEFYGG